MKTLVSTLVIILLTTTIVSAATYEERNEKYREQINGEINRAHEIELEAAKADVYAKQILLGREDVNITVNDTDRHITRNQFDNKFTHNISFNK